MTDTGNRREPSALTRQWTTHVVNTCNVPMSRREVTVLLENLQDRLVAAIRAEQADQDAFDDSEGARIGSELTRHNIAQAETLGSTLRLLNEHLLSSYGLPDTETNRMRLNRLTARLSVTYLQGAKDLIFRDQDQLRASVMLAREVSEQGRRFSEARFRAVFDSTTVGIVIGDLTGTIHETNPAFAKMLGYSQAELNGMRVWQLVHREDWPKVEEEFLQLIRGEFDNDNFIQLPRLLRKDGDLVWSRIVVSMVRDEDTGAPSYSVAMAENTSDMHLLYERLHQQSVADQLTGLANQNRMRSHLDWVLVNCAQDSRVAVAVWDLDGFRVLNDGLGRKLGDEMLITVGHRLQAFFEPHGGLVARTAGDGFAVVLANAPDRYESAQLVQVAMNELAEPFYPGGGTDGVAASASVGLAVETVGEANAEELVRSAEIALHRAKTGGKAQWMLAEKESDAEERRRCRLGAVLPGALETGEFVLRYQPALHLDSHTLAGVHAIPFWQHPEHGLLRPAEFMPLAAETGMMLPIGRWLLGEVCDRMTRWLNRYGDDAPTMQVRLAERMVRDQDLVRDVNELLERHRLPAEKFQFSVSVTALSDPAAIDTLVALAGNGVRMGVEGVGAGGLSLARLGGLPLSDIAMNPTLIETVTALDEQQSSPFERGLSCLVSIAHELNCTVSVGDLRDPAQLPRLHAYGIDVGFGPALRPPAEPEDIELVLDTYLAR